MGKHIRKVLLINGVMGVALCAGLIVLDASVSTHPLERIATLGSILFPGILVAAGVQCLRLRQTSRGLALTLAGLVIASMLSVASLMRANLLLRALDLGWRDDATLARLDEFRREPRNDLEKRRVVEQAYASELYLRDGTKARMVFGASETATYEPTNEELEIRAKLVETEMQHRVSRRLAALSAVIVVMFGLVGVGLKTDPPEAGLVARLERWIISRSFATSDDGRTFLRSRSPSFPSFVLSHFSQREVEVEIGRGLSLSLWMIAALTIAQASGLLLAVATQSVLASVPLVLVIIAMVTAALQAERRYANLTRELEPIPIYSPFLARLRDRTRMRSSGALRLRATAAAVIAASCSAILLWNLQAVDRLCTLSLTAIVVGALGYYLWCRLLQQVRVIPLAATASGDGTPSQK